MYQPKPAWLRQRLPSSPIFGKVNKILEKHQVNTVCQEAKCPNQWECFSQQTATFLILGSKCTRNCKFCAVKHGIPDNVDQNEAIRIALAARDLQLSYIVVTSVTRDDLPDGGASVFVNVINQIRHYLPEALIEVLIPDFQGDYEALSSIIRTEPNILNHNIETVHNLYPIARPGADYYQSLNLLSQVKELNKNIPVKSGLMLGLGETENEIRKTLADLVDSGCSILTIGQYLQPSLNHLAVQRFVHPNEFDYWKNKALDMGFSEVASGPFVRSSYKAREMYRSISKI